MVEGEANLRGVATREAYGDKDGVEVSEVEGGGVAVEGEAAVGEVSVGDRECVGGGGGEGPVEGG